MITKEFILNNLQEIIDDDSYIVDVKINANSKIIIHVDNKEGIKLQACQQIHRELYTIIETKIDNFDLEVSSPGLLNNLKVWQQYEKIIDNRIHVVTTIGETFEGVLTTANETEIEISTSKQEQIKLLYTQIKKAKQVINFNKNQKK